VHAREAILVLGTHPDAAHAWHQALEAIVSADPRQRDSVWAMVTIALSALADPKVLDSVSPRPGEHFDPDTFLRNGGTVYLLGTSSGVSATAGLVGAFVEDVVEAARRIAARSPSSRLDPPLSLVMDEAANYPLPSLPSLMSDGGGSGISTIVVLQSLAQARAVWGENQASAIWDAAIVKTILGGGSNARDLEDLSKLIGLRDQHSTSSSRGPDGRSSTSTTMTKVPIMEPAALRTLPFGDALLLLKSAPPIALKLKAWTARKDAKTLTADRERMEAIIRASHDEARIEDVLSGNAP
jgi:type IV secretory pathway TraG/TraD family ATPase VirD4